MPRVAVAVSGGIDSLVAAFLLKKAGHDILGVHFRTGYESAPPAEDRVSDVVSRMLNIPVEVVDLKAAFKETVVSDFIRTYMAGRTPNPCMVCNAAIKFGRLLNIALDKGADHLATGHYARLAREEDGRIRLRKGTDPVKDQSYFLARLTQAQLCRALFPLGDLKKAEVLTLARNEGLFPATLAESQDVCFVQGRSYMDFILAEGGGVDLPGPVTDPAGRIIGEHAGLFRYTVGQRRGIGIPGPEPYYVARVDPAANRLVVGTKKDLLSSGCWLTDMNWIASPPARPFHAKIRLRYRHRETDAEIFPIAGNRVEARFAVPQSAVTPGQAGVLYDGDRVLGGGWIESAAPFKTHG